MSWAKVDDQWFAHPKVVGLSLAARGLWITTLSWSCAQRTDHLPEHMVRFLAGREDADPLFDELVDAGLWIEDGDGWLIHDWDDYQNLSLSEKRARAGKKGAEKRWADKADSEEPEQAASPPQNGKSWQTDSKQDLPGMANTMAGTPTRPVPTQPEDQTLGDADAPQDDRDLIFETIADVCGLDWKQGLPKDARGRINKAAKQLKEIDATPQLIVAKARAYRRKFPDAELTPQALTGNWAQVDAQLEPVSAGPHGVVL